MPNTLDVTFTIGSAELMPHSRKALFFGIQKTMIAEYLDVLLVSRQALNKDVKATIHSGHDEKNLYVQFRIGEKEDDKRKSWSPESLVQLATDCKKNLENLYNRAIKAIGLLRRCPEDVEKIEF